MERWQFSLGSCLATITLMAVGCCLVRLADVPNEWFPDGELGTVGAFFCCAAPGMLIGYGVNRHEGAMLGGVLCGLVGFFGYDFYLVCDGLSGWD